ncbi:MAG: polyamine aminopropyltransferase [Candidatus Thermoplasmatota archaeon]|nr:polyamine aminopropyltransferase [Candidatus Thermoplasmatota archaeon]MCL5731236.1 polyamine aminopropyltransferase [Candidatus Thermoplasmatota archaeon]
MKLIENWFSERYSDNLQLSFRVSDQLLSIKTDFQRIDLFDTYDFGKLLTIDGTVQMAEKDEHIYHEMITMVPFYLATKRPESALVIGGGDGGTARRLLDLGLSKIVNVEIDSQVVELSRRFFPEIASSLSDPRVNLIIDDGIKYVSRSKEKFDMVIIDSTDPVGPAEGLFTAEFYGDVKRILNDGGVAVTQSGSPFYQPFAIRKATGAIRSAFGNSLSYLAFIPTYPSGLWSFTMNDPGTGRNEEIRPARYFNKDILEGCVRLPQFVKELIA